MSGTRRVSTSQTKFRKDKFFAAKVSSSLLRFPSVVGRTNRKLILRALVEKTADRKTIIDYHAGGQTGKTIIKYHEEFEHAQSE